MQFVDPVLMYACAGRRDDYSARRAGMHHFPGSATLPGPALQRQVEPDGDAARRDVEALLKKPIPGRELLLMKFGEGLHPLQDSWAHQGVPDAIDLSASGLDCDPLRSWANPGARGGWNSHKADHTFESIPDAMRMAEATYKALVRFSPIDKGPSPRSWDELRSQVADFAGAKTKVDKSRWFRTHGIQDDGFLTLTTLPDGPRPFLGEWHGDKLPHLGSASSEQRGVDAALLAFLNDFFLQWAGSSGMEELARRVGPRPASRGSTATRELAARLTVWKLRGHGRYAAMAHKLSPLTAGEIDTLNRAAKLPEALVVNREPQRAFIPLLPRDGSDVSPLLPFFVVSLPESGSDKSRALAIVKFRNAPYDTVAVLAQRQVHGWAVTSIRAVVDH
jgi:hypothetical protein